MLEQKIEILDIDKNPLEKMGHMAGICWNAPVDDPEKNRKRAIECIKSEHGRVQEFVDVTMAISGVSCRLGRELYTHIGGAPTRLQRSTRYVNESGFNYYEPASCKDSDFYWKAMDTIAEKYSDLLGAGIPKEDAANILPLGLDTKIVWKVNLRTLVNFFNRRLCARALKEIREFALLLRRTLESQGEEWKSISRMLFVPSCEIYKFRNPALCFCREGKCCGRYPKIEDFDVSRGNPVESAEPYLPKCIGCLQRFDLNRIKPMIDSMTDMSGKRTFGFEETDHSRTALMRDVFLVVARWLTENSDVDIREDDVMLQGKYGEELYMTATCRNNDKSRRYEVARMCLVNDATQGGVYWAFVRSDPQAMNERQPVKITPEAVVDVMKDFLNTLPWNL